MARVCATSPCTISQSAERSFENAVPLGNVKTGAFRKTASSTCASLGEWSNPEEVPATVKKRFGHVGPGIAANPELGREKVQHGELVGGKNAERTGARV